MSIFTRDCPACGATHPVNTVRCGCGYCFDPNKLDGVTQELEVISHEEKLYSDYLSARADQAEKAMMAAKTSLTMDPDSTVKAAEALLAEQAALTARAEYDAQTSRAQAISSRIKVVKAGRRARRVAKVSADSTKSKAGSVREALAPPPPAPVTPVATAPSPIPPRITPKPHAVPKVRPNGTDTAKMALVAKPAVTNLPAKVTVRPKTATRRLAAVPATPPTIKPAAVMRPAAIARPAPPSSFDKPTSAFRATQANRAEELHSITARSTHECPNCTAVIKPNTKRCGCGFELISTDNQIPALALSPEEQAAFLAALSPTIPRNKG